MLHKLFKKLTYYIRQYFGFSRNETYGTLFLLLLLTCALLLPYLLYLYDLHTHPHLTITYNIPKSTP